jgi:hypothetical protein
MKLRDVEKGDVFRLPEPNKMKRCNIQGLHPASVSGSYSALGLD